MKYIHFAFLLSLLSLLSSCISKEPLNTECDIEEATIPGGVLASAPDIDNHTVLMTVKSGVNLTNLAPEFIITPGATIYPPSGTHLNFIFPQTYTVTSQDGEWHKEYTVSIRRENQMNLDYNFENIRTVSGLGGKATYDVFYEVNGMGQEEWAWATANPAFVLTLQGTSPNTFPTYQGDDGVDDSKCAVLVTRSTGSFGQMAGKPMAAGNLFMGRFDTQNAMAHPLESTMFGRTFYSVPMALNGFYKYTPGETFQEPDASGKLKPVPGRTDEFNIYAVFFEKTTSEYLNGTNVLSPDNPQVIATAIIPDHTAKSEWTEFQIPFTFREGKTVDLEKLKKGEYSIAIVFSSSIDGDYYKGAIGSTLMVDKVSLTCYNESADEEEE